MNRGDAMRARIGTRLRERRRALGMIQVQCAALIGLPHLALTRLELGYRRLKLSELGTVCQTLGCSAEDLLGDPVLAQAAMRNAHRLNDGLSLG
ncbi:MAG TPA: helix-turn-helix transcriptional regulator [Stellaceae bacterium]|nr:helix-turn-helix transcriptional regulator [Stellaceae bacterium]